MDVTEMKNVANADVFEVRNGEDVAWIQNVLSSNHRSDYILGRLGTDEIQCGSGRVRCGVEGGSRDWTRHSQQTRQGWMYAHTFGECLRKPTANVPGGHLVQRLGVTV